MLTTCIISNGTISNILSLMYCIRYGNLCIITFYFCFSVTLIIYSNSLSLSLCLSLSLSLLSYRAVRTDKMIRSDPWDSYPIWNWSLSTYVFVVLIKFNSHRFCLPLSSAFSLPSSSYLRFFWCCSGLRRCFVTACIVCSCLSLYCGRMWRCLYLRLEDKRSHKNLQLSLPFNIARK